MRVAKDAWGECYLSAEIHLSVPTRVEVEAKQLCHILRKVQVLQNQRRTSRLRDLPLTVSHESALPVSSAGPVLGPDVPLLAVSRMSDDFQGGKGICA